MTIVATKYDKVTKNILLKQDKLIKETLNLDENESFIPFSTITKKGREDIYQVLDKCL